MTVSATTETRKQYTGNASYTTSTDFTAAFKYLDTSEIKVTHTNASTSADTAYVEGTHYSVQSGAAATSVTIRFLTSYVPTATTEYITIYRETPFSQLTDYTEGSALDAETLEQNFDKAIMLIQQVNNNLTDLNLSFTSTNDFNTTAAAASDIGASKADRAGKYLTFDTNGDIDVTASIEGVTYTETSIATGDILVYNGTAFVNTKLLARITQILDSSGNEVIKFGTTGSAVNEITVTNAATGNPPTISATGEADKGIDFENSEGEELLKLASVSSAVNEVKISNAATGNAPTLSATGDDDNIDITLTPKGTGEVVIGTGSASGKITTNSTQDLVLDTYSGTNSGTITITDGANGNIDITPNGTGEVNLPKVDIDDGTIGGITIDGNWTAAGQTCADLGSVTTCDINGGTINGITDLAVADGGTGASSASDARTNLGVVNVPSNIVCYRASGESTPSGWSEYTSVRGRMIVGLPSGGTDGGTVGTGFTDVQDKTKADSHQHTGPSHQHGNALRSIPDIAYNDVPPHGTSGSITISKYSSEVSYSQTGAEMNTKAGGTGNTGAGGTDVDTSDLLAYVQLLAIKKD